MIVLPVVTRELGVQARRRGTYWMRLLASLAAGLLTLWLLVVTSAALAMSSQGQTLFFGLSVLGFAYCLVIGPLVTVDCLSAEKREGTLGLLFLTDLKGYDVIFGKMLSSSVHAVYGLLALLPMMSVTLLYGGVTAGEIARMSLVLGNTLFFSLAVGIFVSTVSQNERKGALFAFFIILAVTAGPYEVAYLLHFRNSTPALDEAILSPSPLYAFTQARAAAAGPGQLPMLLQSLAQTQALAWLLLVLSCVIVPHVWKDRPKGRPRERWSEWWRSVRWGKPEVRAAYRGRLLAQNPLLWLSHRYRFQGVPVWFMLFLLSAIGVWVYTRHPLAFYEASFVLAGTMFVLMKVWFANEICQRWIEDKQNGSLELLLCAPLQTKELVHGQSLALRRQFAWPVVAALCLLLIAWRGIVRTTGFTEQIQTGVTWLLLGGPALLADLAALRWVGLWRGLQARGLNRALASTLGRVLGLRWVLFLFVAGTSVVWSWAGLGQVPFVSSPWCWLLLALALDLAFGWTARSLFFKHLRSIAANPKEWKGGQEEPERPGLEAKQADGPADTAEEPSRAASISKPRRRRPIPAWAVVVLLAIGVPAGYHLFLKWRIETRISAMRAAGFPASLREFQDARPPFTNDANAAVTLDQIRPLLVNLYRLPQSVLQHLPGFPVERARLPYPIPMQARQAMNTVLETNQAVLAMLKTAPSLKHGRYDPDSIWGGGSRFGSQIESLHHVSFLLRFEALLKCEAGDFQGAFASMMQLLDLGHSLNGEPAPITQHHQKLCLDGVVQVLQYLLSRTSLPSSTLDELDASLADFQSDRDLERDLSAIKFLLIEWHRTSPMMGFAARQGGPTLEQLRLQVQMHLRSWSGADGHALIAALDAVDAFMSLERVPWAERIRRTRSIAPASQQDSIGRNLFSPFSSDYVFDMLVLPLLEMTTRGRLARLAIQLERFRLENQGRAPDSLRELVPKCLLEVPVDPYDGQPIRYERGPRGYRIYSIGPNGTDEKGSTDEPGQAPYRQRREGDIVFEVGK